MKRNVRILIVTLITIVCFASGSLAFAEGSQSAGSTANKQNNYTSEISLPDSQNEDEKTEFTDENGNIVEEESSDTSEAENDNALKEKNGEAAKIQNGNTSDERTVDPSEAKNGKALKEQNRILEQNKNMLKAEIKTLKKEKNQLENQLKEAVKTENKGLESELKVQIQQMEQNIDATEEQIKQIKEQIRETIRNTYTVEEKNKLKDIEEELKKNYRNIKVLPVESIIINGASVKFDTPPVIKDGRTLIPVRALTEAFGASVAWDKAEQKITIEKDGVKIVLSLQNNLAYINGKEEKIDVPPEIINNRTVVPLSFIAKNLGLNVDWDAESETIEVEDVPTAE